MSPLVDTEMSEQQEEEILGVAPKDKYIVKVAAVRVAEDGTNIFVGQTSGNRMLRLAFQIDDDDPKKIAHKGKFPKDYNAVYGTGFMAMLRRAFPSCCEGPKFDTDAVVGMRCIAKLIAKEYEGVTKNEIQALAPLKE